jgi:hypothetical protein
VSAVREARDRLAGVLATSGIRVILDFGRSPDTPCLMIPLPTLTYDAYYSGPTNATFRVGLVVSADDRTGEQLYDLLDVVDQALDGVSDIAMTGPVEPGSWGSPPLPAFLLPIEVSV